MTTIILSISSTLTEDEIIEVDFRRVARKELGLYICKKLCGKSKAELKE
jgi:hypothetical protein